MNFDVLAPHYRWMEFVLAGDKLQRCRTAFLHHVTHYQDVLLVGEGNGRFLLECRRALENARITCVDLSPRMLTLARERLHDSASNLAGVEFIRADALAWTPPVQAFDLVVTHFFLDCFRPEQLQRVIGALAIGAKPKATWLLADFQIPSAGLRRYRALFIHRLMYHFFRIATRLPARSLTPPDDFLRMHDFVLRERQHSEWGLIHTDRWERL